MVHKSLISHHSPFFQKAFTSSFTEGLTQTITLEDVSALIFGLFVHWLYFQKLSLPDGNLPTLLQHGKLYVLAERFMVPLLPKIVLQSMSKVGATVINAPDPAPGQASFLELCRFAYTTEPQDWQDNLLKKFSLSAGMYTILLYERSNNKRRREFMDKFPEHMLADLMEATIDGVEDYHKPGGGGVAMLCESVEAITKRY